MDEITEIGIETIEGLPYVRLLAMLKESNRPPGGVNTIREFIGAAHLRPGMRVLHAGCNAGFLTRELARRAGCRVLGIDISPDMVQAATARAHDEAVDSLVVHETRDMRDSALPAADFDVVLSGGALAFVQGHQAALEEWKRLVKPFGLLVDAELYYSRNVPGEVRAKVEDIIGVQVPEYNRAYWYDLFTSDELEPYYTRDAPVHVPSPAEVDRYCERMAQQAGGSWTPGARAALRMRLQDIFSTFNENLSYMSYIVVARRYAPSGSEPALYV